VNEYLSHLDEGNRLLDLNVDADLLEREVFSFVNLELSLRVVLDLHTSH